MEKLNIAELLKDCPKGMELDCTMYDSVQLYDVIDRNTYPIKIQTPDGVISLTENGCYFSSPYGKCIIFPKGKTTWEGFQRPFKDGDVVVDTFGGIHIMRNASTSYCYFDRLGILDKTETSCVRVDHLATEEEKQKLFDAIKDNGYRWNPETKTLEKLIVPKFRVGDRIKTKKDAPVDISNILITEVNECSYNGVIGSTTNSAHICFKFQDLYELVPNKFNITTLKPFDKVLVRDNNTQKWTADLFSFFDKSMMYPYSCVGHYIHQCIPYNDETKHLLGTTKECDEYYKTWE